MKSFATYEIAPDHDGLTVENYLRAILLCSGRNIQKLTRSRGIFLNGKPAYLQRNMRTGDILKILRLQENTYGVLPEPGPIEVLYESNSRVVINKPPGQLVHPAGQTKSGTAVNYLAHFFQQQGLVTAIRPMHRLDRDTSGCVLFAKNAPSQSILEEQLASGRLKRLYRALVTGQPQPTVGRIDAPIGDHPRLPNRRCIRDDGKQAVTQYRTLQCFQDASLLELSLETGRTHQIRLHLSYIGHPLIGDGMYGVRSPLIKRQALHAQTIEFDDPEKDQRMCIHAPLPDDFAAALQKLTFDSIKDI